MIGDDVLTVGDLVELVSPLRGRSQPRVGATGRVLVAGLPWGMVSAQFGRDERHCWQVHPRHLRLVQPVPAPAEVAS